MPFNKPVVASGFLHLCLLAVLCAGGAMSLQATVLRSRSAEISLATSQAKGSIVLTPTFAKASGSSGTVTLKVNAAGIPIRKADIVLEAHDGAVIESVVPSEHCQKPQLSNAGAGLVQLSCQLAVTLSNAPDAAVATITYTASTDGGITVNPASRLLKDDRNILKYLGSFYVVKTN